MSLEIKLYLFVQEIYVKGTKNKNWCKEKLIIVQGKRNSYTSDNRFKIPILSFI